MKLHLPLSLLSAVLLVAAGLTSRAQAVEVPSNYTPHYLADPNDLYDYRSTSDSHAFLLDGSTTFTPSSAPWWTYSQELKENGSILFTIEEDSDPYSLTFKGGASKAFYNVSTLAIEDIGRVTFEGLKESTHDSHSSSSYYYYYYGGAINATTLRLKSNSRVTFTGNEVIASSRYDCPYAYGGAIYGANGATITISETSGAVTFAQNKATSSTSSSTSSSYSYGGAIYGGSSSTISICDNEGDVSFTGNSSSSSYYSSHSNYNSYGGAIFGESSSTISICDNGGDVSFTGNSSSSSSKSYGGAIYGGSSSTISICDNGGDVSFIGNSSSSFSNSYGGAIYGGSSSTISISGNTGDVNITENAASSTTSSNSYGGAIYGDYNSTISISGNAGAVNITGNSAGHGGAIYGGSSSTISICDNTQNVLFDTNKATDGGAIYSTGQINLNGNITFSGNTAAEGGAIYGSEVIIRGSAETVTFSDNSTTGAGAAIYSTRSIYIQDSAVDFSRNYEKVGSDYRLRSIYMSSTASDGGHFHLSAAAGKSIEFNDSVYVASETSGQTVDVIFNGSYTDADSNSIAQSGDIIFDGANVASTLESIKGSAATEAEISNSLTSYIGSTTHLEAGRLIIRNGAQFNGLGISTTARSGAAVVLQDAGMNHSSGSINLKRGTSLELSGQNAISAQEVTFSGGSTLKFTVDGANRENAVLNLDANLEHFSFTIAVDGAEMLASGRYKLLELASADQYMDVDGYWNADDITVSGTQDAKGASFDNLVWEDGVLYFEQGKSIWSNGSGNALWDSSSENWQRNGADIRYRNGMDTVFTDEGAGTVQLVGEISPLSISVENSAGNDYRFEASATGGKITGGSAIVKSGSGELVLATANEHTGGTLLQEGTLRVQHSTALGAADATVSTAAGTLLSVENGAQVVLSGADNELKGNVSVAAGAGLQVQSSGYAATHTELNGSLSFTAGATGTAAGSLSGSGKLSISGQGTQVSFSRASNFSGSVSLADGAELAVDSISFAQSAVLEVLMDNISFSVNELMQLNSVNTVGETPAIVSCTDRLSFDSSYTAGTAVNATAGATLNTTGGLTLQGGSTYTANATHLNLNGGSLSFKDCTVAPINLVLTLDIDVLPEEYRIVLFSGVGSMNFDSQALSTLNTSYVFAASDYLSGDYISYTTALIYDSSAQVVYLAEGLAIPEPTTATLSLLALAALAARRRRR